MNEEHPEQSTATTDNPVDDNTESLSAQPEASVLSAIECRILGALLEKQLSTPDAYPMTANALLNACNQKSNREPVSNYQQGEVVRCLRELESRRLVRYDMGARSERYEQRFTHEYNLSKKQHALMSVMMLRGPQTAGELMTRTQRLYQFTDREDMMVSLERLTQGEEAIAVVIPRQSGQKEDRYGHILCGEIQMPETPIKTPRSTAPSAEIESLKSEIAALRLQLEELYALTGHQITQL